MGRSFRGIDGGSRRGTRGGLGLLLARRPGHLEPAVQRADAQTAGLQIVETRMEKLRAEFFDIGAVVYFLRKLIWTVPDFIVELYDGRLREVHEHIQAEGRFVTHPTRVLVEARKPRAD